VQECGGVAWRDLDTYRLLVRIQARGETMAFCMGPCRFFGGAVKMARGRALEMDLRGKFVGGSTELRANQARLE
jgi:hypothetical protein